MTTTDETAPRASMQLHSHSGYAAYMANAFVERGSGIRCTSAEGNSMTVDSIHAEWQQDFRDGETWALSKVEVEGVYVHDADGPAPILTAMPQKGHFHPNGPHPAWLTAVLDELRPPGPPPGHDLTDTQKAALGMAEVPSEALQLLVRSSGMYEKVLSDLGASDDRLILARDALLNVWREVRRDERFGRIAARHELREADKSDA